MDDLSTWDVLGVIATICLISAFFIKGRNAIWGGFILSLIIVVVTFIIYSIRDGSINWDSHHSVLKNIVTVCVLVGAFFEVFGRIVKRKHN